MVIIIVKIVQSIKEKLFRIDSIKIHDTTLKNLLNEKILTHYLISFDLMEYNFKDINKSLKISYFSKDTNLLNNYFTNEDELNDYEYLEEISSESLLVLIKKFKLKVSVSKENQFSQDILISDYYNFNPDFMKNKDSTINIAIIKNDIDYWRDNKNLKNYDYIFVLNKYKELFSNYKNVFVIDAETTYLQIKNILNILYKRKMDKFYLLIRNIGFNNIFPKFNNYFEILNSELFDEEWYKDKYNLAYENTDPAIHYLLIGYKKGFNPGPNFNTLDYYEYNQDIEAIGMNPLVHYELNGKNENRIIGPKNDEQSESFLIISNSEYFDEGWYKETYKISNEGINPVNHYLKIGYKKGYNPSPNFSTNEYYEVNPDVKLTGLNPLLHYELIGKNENRFMGSKEDKDKIYSTILNSQYFDKEWYESHYDISKDGLDPVIHYLKVGFKKGYEPGPNFDSEKYYKDNEGVKENGFNPLFFHEFYE